METLKTTLIQSHLVWENAEANRQNLEKQFRKIDDTDLVILPEMFTTGFSMNAKPNAEQTQGKSLAWLQQWAKQLNSAITGSVIISEKESFYNRLFFVFPDGSFKTYDKKHLFTLANEQDTYTAGKDRLVVEYLGWKICPLVCYDLRFPVWARNTVDYDVLLYVANWPAKRINAWDALLKARAIENMSYCIGVNRIGTDGNGFEHVGHSAVYNALGELISSKELETELVQTISLQKNHLSKTRSGLKFLQDRDAFTLS